MTGGRKAPSEGGPNTTMVTLAGACAAAGAGVDSASERKRAERATPPIAENRCHVIPPLVACSLLALALRLVIEFEIAAPPGRH